MSLDLTLLRLLKYRENYDKWARAIPEGMVQPSTHILLKDLGSFFKENPDAKVGMPDAFIPYFTVKHPKLPDDKRAIYVAMLQKAGEDVPDSVRDGISTRLTNARIAMDMASKSSKSCICSN